MNFEVLFIREKKKKFKIFINKGLVKLCYSFLKEYYGIIKNYNYKDYIVICKMFIY